MFTKKVSHKEYENAKIAEQLGIGPKVYSYIDGMMEMEKLDITLYDYYQEHLITQKQLDEIMVMYS